MKAYNEHKYHITMFKFCPCFVSQDNIDHIRILQIEDKYPEPEKSNSPENLNWENFGFSLINRSIRIILMWILTFAILLVTFSCVSAITTS